MKTTLSYFVLLILLTASCKKDSQNTSVTLPIVNTSDVISVTTNGAVCGGVVSSDGGAAVITRGICWATTSLPVITDNKVAQGQGTGTFSITLSGLTLAREGRKFKVGLIAITQLPSLIPRDILANMNTKIILGTEMVQERQAIIDSASQDLSTDSRNIASLDKGECIVSSNFAKFAIPIKVPLFSDFAKKEIQLKLKEGKSTKNNKENEKEILGLGE